MDTEKKLNDLMTSLREYIATSEKRVAENAIARGKANFKLMMTLSTAERDFWFTEKTRNQNFFEFGAGTKVYYRACTIQKSHSQQEYLRNVQHAYQELCDDMKNPYSDKKKEKEVFIANMLVAASNLLESLCKFQNPTKHSIGEICDIDDNFDPTMDLVDLYAENTEHHDHDAAVSIIFDQYGLPQGTFESVPIDNRTNWDMQRFPSKDIRIFSDAAKSREQILFMSHQTILGAVYVDKENGLIPFTCWRKSSHTKGLGLTIPFACPMPFWNMPEMQYYADRTIILTDDLVAAYRAQEKIKDEITKQKKEKTKSFSREKIYLLEEYEENFEKGLEEAARQYIDTNCAWIKKEMGDEYERRLTISYWIARFFYCIACEFKENESFEEYWDTYVSQLHYVEERVSTFLNQMNLPPKKYRDEAKLEKETIKNDPNRHYSPCNSVTPTQENCISGLYNFIIRYIEGCREKDQSEIAKIEEDLQKAEKFCFLSWFGGSETIDKLDWKRLHNRTVVFAISSETKEAYLTALRIALYLQDQKAVFSFSTIGAQGLLSYDDIKTKAQEFGIDSSQVTQKKISRYSALDTFNPNEKIPPVEYVLDKLISKRSTTLLYAPTGIGKTWFTLCLAQAMCHGTAVFENDARWMSSKKQRVVYIDSEMNPSNFHARLKIIENIYGRNGHDAYPLKYKQVAPLNMNLVKDEEEDIDRTRITEWLSDEAKSGTPVDVLILDNLSTLSGFNDTAKAWDNLARWMKELNNLPHPIACIVVHHSNKQGDQRGSSAKTATVDNVIFLEPQTDDNVSEPKIRSKKGCLNFIVHIQKGRDIPDHTSSDFNFPVELNLNNGQESCKVVTPSKKDAVKSQEARAYLKGEKIPPHDVIAMLTGLSVNTIKMYSHEIKKQQK